MSTYSKWNTTVKNSSGTAIVLQVINAPAANVTLKAINGKVPNQSSNGVNGSFYNFSNGDLLSIAVQGDFLVKDGPYGGRYNVGEDSNSRPKGTLVYDSFAGSASIQVVDDYKKISVSKRYLYWAQGGVSMGLYNANWAAQLATEQLPQSTNEVARTALGYTNGSSCYIYGIVTTTPCTAEKFREAIKSAFTLDGAIFMDSGPSSQMKAVDGSGNPVSITGGNDPQEMVVFG